MQEYHLELRKLVSKTNLNFVHYNAKVGVSLDIDSFCPRQLAGKECAYCYVRAMKERSFMTLKETQYYDPQDWGVLHSQKFRHFLMLFHTLGLRFGVKRQFIRLFSKSDYKREHKGFWTQVLNLCKKEHVKTVVITKQQKAVTDLSDYATTVQFSIDRVSNDKTVLKAQATHARNSRPNVVVRAVACSEQEILALGSTVDILTLYHNDAQGELRQALKQSFPETVESAWKPENYQGRVRAYICCASKGDGKHAKCVYCGNCLKALERKRRQNGLSQ